MKEPTVTSLVDSWARVYSGEVGMFNPLKAAARLSGRRGQRSDTISTIFQEALFVQTTTWYEKAEPCLDWVYVQQNPPNQFRIQGLEPLDILDRDEPFRDALRRMGYIKFDWCDHTKLCEWVVRRFVKLLYVRIEEERPVFCDINIGTDGDQGLVTAWERRQFELVQEIEERIKKGQRRAAFRRLNTLQRMTQEEYYRDPGKFR